MSLLSRFFLRNAAPEKRMTSLEFGFACLAYLKDPHGMIQSGELYKTALDKHGLCFDERLYTLACFFLAETVPQFDNNFENMVSHLTSKASVSKPGDPLHEMLVSWFPLERDVEAQAEILRKISAS